MSSKGGTILYRCRLCGEIARQVHAPDGTGYLIAAMYNIPSKEWGQTVDSRNMFAIHTCQDGRTGVADLVGYEDDGEGA